MEREEKIYSAKIEMLKDALKEAQSTIAKQDVKARFLLAINLAIIAISLFPLKFLYADSCHSFPFWLNSLIFIEISIVIILNLVIIYKLISNVINPIINPKNFVKKIPKLSYLTVYFPISNEGCYDFEKYKEILDSINGEEEILNIYTYELLKVSYIREGKIKNLNKIVNLFRYLLIFLFVYFLTLILSFVSLYVSDLF